MQTTLASGSKAGVWFGVGLGLMAAVWTGLALLGLEAIFHVFPWAYGTIKIFGAVYLLYLAIKMWQGSKQALAESDHHNQQHAFVHGILVNALNPKSIFFAAAVLAVVFPPNMHLLESLLVVFNQFIVEVAFYALLAHVMGREAIRSTYIKLKRALDRCASLVLGGFGLSLIVDRYVDS